MPPFDLTSRSALEEHYGKPRDIVQKKTLKRLDRHCRNFIAASPFLVIGSSQASGPADVSPRGEAPGFVAVLDDCRLLIPDRPGNRKLDTFSNILENPHVALIFFIPGMNETLRVNGRARLTTDQELLAPLSAQGKAPLAGIIVEVEEAFLHCAKALMRSHLWDPGRHIERRTFPTLGTMIADQVEGIDAEDADKGIDLSYKEKLY
ncbi:MAG: pyridoxamine 5'-phosphate oxidase family protein [Pseudomonadota bacterium]